MRALPAILAALLGLAVAAPAMAQTTPTPTATAPAPAPAPGTMQKDISADLSKAGFTDIQVMPSSFLVRAKDKSGHPVMMVINPDSVTEVTNLPSAKPAHK